jgi:hypothetical protein
VLPMASRIVSQIFAPEGCPTLLIVAARVDGRASGRPAARLRFLRGANVRSVPRTAASRFARAAQCVSA